MAPRGRKKKAGMMREDAARDAMRAFGFAERLINVCIKELLEVFGAEGWFLIEECSYLVLLNKCLEKSAEQGPNLPEERIEERGEEEQNDEMMVEAEKEQNDELVAGAEKEQNDEMVAEAEPEPEQNHDEMVEAVQEQNTEMLEAEQEHTPRQEEEKEQEEQQVQDGRDHVGSNSTSLVGCVAETGTKTCQNEALSTTSETEILNSSPAREASVVDYTSPAAFPSADASGGFAPHPAAGANLSGRGGWISDSDEDEDPDDGDDDEMIQLTPEPLCEELEELIKEISGEKKKKKRTRWED